MRAVDNDRLEIFQDLKTILYARALAMLSMSFQPSPPRLHGREYQHAVTLQRAHAAGYM